MFRRSTILILALGWLPGLESEPLPFPEMGKVLGKELSENYYDARRIRPRIMVERALRELEEAEVQVDTVWADGKIRLIVAGQPDQVIPAAEPQQMTEALGLIDQVQLALPGSVFTPARRRSLAYIMFNGALTSLDPHTLILPPEPASDFAEIISGQFFGIGAFLHSDDGVISITRVMPGFPAEKAGVRDGDIILRINGEKTCGLLLSQAVSRIKGDRGTEVKLTIERKGVAEPFEISIVRDRVEVPTTRDFRRNGIGYVRMDEFHRFTARSLFAAIAHLKSLEDAPLRGLILDLRFNEGGLLDQAKLVSDLFLGPDQEIVRTVAIGKPDNVLLSGNGLAKTYEPMIVLVGPGSASASEIVSGALQLNDRAVVVGTRTFGKGSVQTIHELPDNSRLKLTIQEYQLKNKVSIQEQGVSPDIELLRHHRDDQGRVDLLPYSPRRERDGEFSLAGHGSYIHDISARLGWLEEHRTREQNQENSLAAVDFKPDQEASLVIDLLAEALSTEAAVKQMAEARTAKRMRQELIELLRVPVQKRADQESASLAAALAKERAGLIWGEDTQATANALQISFQDPGVLAPGTTVDLTFTVRNPGTSAQGRLHGLIRADDFSPFYEDEIIFGAVAPGGQTTGVLRFAVPPRVHGGEERFLVELYQDENPEVLANLPVRLHLGENPRPDFSLTWKMLEEREPHDQKLQFDEPVTFELTIANTGTVATAPVTMLVFKDDDPFVDVGEGRKKLGVLEPGKSALFRVPITVRKTITVNKVAKSNPSSVCKLHFRIDEDFPDGTDERFRAGLFYTLDLPLDQPIQGRTVVEPRLQLVANTVDPQGTCHLSVLVTDDNPAFVALFLGEDKIDLHACPGSPWTYETSLPLKDGLNRLRVVAQDQDKLVSLLPLRLWRGEVATAAKTATATRNVLRKPKDATKAPDGMP